MKLNRKNILIFATHYQDQILTRKKLINALKLSPGINEVACAIPHGNRDVSDDGLMKIHYLVGTRASKSFFNNLKLMVSMMRLVHFERPEIVITIGLQPRIFWGFLNCFYKIRSATIVNGRGRIYLEQSDIILKILFFFVKIFAQASYYSYDLFITQNTVDTDFFKKFTNSIVLQVAGSGVDLNKFKPFPQTTKIYDFLFVGRMLKSKGMDDLKLSLEHMKNSNHSCRVCVVLSDLSNSDVDSSMIASLEKLEVDVRIFPQDVSRLLQQAKYAVLPSYQEGCSRFLLEACASGVPIITYDSIGCSDFFRDVDLGWKVQRGSVDDLSSAMHAALQLDEDSYNQKSSKARKQAEELYGDTSVVAAMREGLLQMVTSSEENS